MKINAFDTSIILLLLSVNTRLTINQNQNNEKVYFPDNYQFIYCV